jgi:hypothetical protein
LLRISILQPLRGDFCNTIGGIADIAGLTTWLGPVANDPNAHQSALHAQ